ncbi:MAG: TonB-dependent receptor [Acidobacteriota bacterium]
MFAAIAMILGSGTARAATTGSLQGSITDAAGRPVVGASVTLRSAYLIDRERSMATDEVGAYRFLGLPPGDYDVMVAHAGHQTQRQDGLRIPIGATATLDIVLQPPPVEMTVEVNAREGMVEPERQETSTKLDHAMIDNLPTLGRHYSDLLMLAPGVVNKSDQGVFGASNPNVHGARADANQYFFDGGNTTDNTYGHWGPRFNLDAIDQIDILTAGYTAEYGRADGAMTNILTKSGGNDFEGSFRFDYRKPVFDRTGTEKQAYRYYSGTLGGPIVRDRAWFFASLYVLDEVDSKDFGDDALFPRQDSPSLLRDVFAKVSYQINADHQMVLSFHQDPSLKHNVYPEPTVAPSARYEQAITGNYYLAKETAALSSRALLESTLFVVDGRETRTGPDSDAPPSTSPWNGTEADTGEVVGVGTAHGRFLSDRSQLREDFSLFLDGPGGTHDLKLGMSYELEMAFQSQRDEPSYDLRGGVPFKKHYTKTDPRFSPTTDAHSRVATAYAQDSWTPRSGLTLNLGLRADYQALEFRGLGGFDRMLSDPTFHPEDRPVTDGLISNTVVAPRLGFAWDPREDGKSVLRGSLGRFYLTHEGVVGEWERTSVTTGYECDTDAEGNCLNERDFRTDYFVDPHLKLPYTDEATLGYEREVFPEASAGITAIYRKSHGLLQDIGLNVVYTDGNGDGFPETRTYVNPSFKQVFYLGSNDSSEYEGLELTFRKRLSHSWQLLSSYTHAVARGDGEWLGTAENDDTRLAASEYGYLAYDQRHFFKAAGSYFAPLGFVLTGIAQYQTGTPYSTLISNFYDENGNGIYDLGEGEGGTRFFGGRNMHRNDSYFNLDLRAEKELRFKGTTVGVFVNLLNVFNNHAVIRTSAIVTPYDENCDPSKRDCSGPNEVSISQTRRIGRQVQLGLRFSFGGHDSRSAVTSSPSTARTEERPPPPAAPPATPPVGPGTEAAAPPEPRDSRAANYTPKRRTLVGTILDVDREHRSFTIDVGIDKIAAVAYDDTTEISGGELGAGKRVKVKTAVSGSAARRATSIKILD